MNGVNRGAHYPKPDHMKETQDYIDDHKDRFVEELLDFLRIPSVSADPAYSSDVRKAAEWLSENLAKAGADKVEIHETPGHPIVYGEKIKDPSLPTILVYGHYDVQPPDPMDLWHSPPFEPVIKDGNVYARGACDDKGQMYMHVKAFEAMTASDSLPCNVKFVLEGEEEVGSDNLEGYLEQNAKMLDCDVVLVSDTSIIANDVPSITVGLRGLSYVEIEVTGPNRDLHSGTYGGTISNPINSLCEMIASLKDENGHITIPGFYDDVEIVSASDRAAMNEAPFDRKVYEDDLEINSVFGEKGYTTIERGSIRLTLDVNGIWGGYTGEGAKTVLPSKAYAKLSMRLVPNQSSDKITELFSNHFASIAPPGIEVVVKPHHGGEPVVTPTDTPEYQAAALAMKETFGKEPIPSRGGGSIPIVALFERILGTKTVLMGFGLDSDNIHSPNEKYGLFNYYKGIETIPYFYHHYHQLKTQA